MAIDLRFILSVIKINGDLERIGDQATNIASRTQFLHDSPHISLPIDIPDMGEKVGVMIRRAIQSLLEADAKLAESVLAGSAASLVRVFRRSGWICNSTFAQE